MKDAYYFSHDSNARNDHKILNIRKKHGMKGYGIYFGIIEMLRESSNYRLLNDCSTIAYDLREDYQDVEDIVENYDLFIFEDGCFFSQSLNDRMKKLDDNRIKRSIAGRKGGLASSSKRQANVDDRSSSKVKKSKVNESKEKNTQIVSFEEIWKEYPKPVGKKDALRHFTSSVKTASDLESLRAALKNYKNSLSVKNGFIQNGSTWFNNWRDWVNFVEKESPKKQDKPVQHIPSANTTLEMMEQWKKEQGGIK